MRFIKCPFTPHTTLVLLSCCAPVPFRLAKRFLLDLTDFGSCRYNLQSSAQKPTRKRKRRRDKSGSNREKKLVIKWKAKWNGRRTQVQERKQQLVAQRIHGFLWNTRKRWGRRSCLPVARDACDFLWDGEWQLATDASCSIHIHNAKLLLPLPSFRRGYCNYLAMECYIYMCKVYIPVHIGKLSWATNAHILVISRGNLVKFCKLIVNILICFLELNQRKISHWRTNKTFKCANPSYFLIELNEIWYFYS